MADALKVKKSSPVLIAAAWVIVVLPTLWGLNYTVQNALKIFAKPAAVGAPANAPAKATPAK
jgi:K+ transporter